MLYLASTFKAPPLSKRKKSCFCETKTRDGFTPVPYRDILIATDTEDGRKAAGQGTQTQSQWWQWRVQNLA